VETIDLSRFSPFPTVDMTKLYVLEQGEVNSGMSTEALKITESQALQYNYPPSGTSALTGTALTVSTVGPKLVLDKKIVEINGRAYNEKAIPEFAPGETKEMLVLFALSNQGSSVAENVLLRVNSGIRFEPIADELPSNCSIVSGSLEAVCASLTPGETRQVQVRYRAVDDVCSVIYDSTSLVNNMTAVYSGTYALSGKLTKDVFTIPDESILDLPAYDFQSARFMCSTREAVPGQAITLNTKFVNGAIPAENVSVGFYAVINNIDTVLLAMQDVPFADAHAVTTITADVNIPDSAMCIEFITRIDDKNGVGEFCEFNNVQSLKLPLRGLDWILNVANYPNPMRDETMLSYVLPREVSDMTLTVYNLDGREIGRIENPPGEIGLHSIRWRDAQLSAGTYIYTFRGTDDLGVTKTYSGRVVKL
jgi:hypothetical protein